MVNSRARSDDPPQSGSCNWTTSSRCNLEVDTLVELHTDRTARDKELLLFANAVRQEREDINIALSRVRQKEQEKSQVQKERPQEQKEQPQVQKGQEKPQVQKEQPQGQKEQEEQKKPQVQKEQKKGEWWQAQTPRVPKKQEEQEEQEK